MLSSEITEKLKQLTAMYGTLIRVDPQTFLSIIEYNTEPLILVATSSILRRKQYLTTYKGVAFVTKSSQPLDLPAHAEIIPVRRLVIPLFSDAGFAR